ncbi:galactokinase [Pseudonocardia humida]|uniref:Galactokinase n=1 Tax=Pseudonocardia humida TaxID=2800819 RepID=A0ABT1A137_9PSEU|nr:galactokinase [Pseudonocardia humida]MCO1656709.1 galactokinase [Pseudonocardia humida]
MNGFASEFGREPAGRWAAPGRVNLIGEHVDYADGLCLPFAIAQRTVVAAADRDDAVLRLRSLAERGTVEIDLDDVGTGSPAGWGGYAAGVLWALRAAGHPVRGLDLLVTDTVPLGAGLSSSAALECATALAADDLFGLGLGGTPEGRRQLAAACVRAENEIVGAATGGMDQAAALLATAGHALLLDTHDGSTRQVPFDPQDAGLQVLVIDTKVRHHLADGRYGNRRTAVEKAAETLGLPSLRDATLDQLAALDPGLARRGRHIVTEIGRVREAVALLDAGLVTEIGPLLDASHTSLAEDYEVSCAELDLACATARAAGALGARMVGGGFGGSAIALVPVARAEAVERAVRAAFEADGYREPDFIDAEPSPAAARLATPGDSTVVGLVAAREPHQVHVAVPIRRWPTVRAAGPRPTPAPGARRRRRGAGTGRRP